MSIFSVNKVVRANLYVQHLARASAQLVANREAANLDAEVEPVVDEPIVDSLPPDPQPKNSFFERRPDESRQVWRARLRAYRKLSI